MSELGDQTTLLPWYRVVVTEHIYIIIYEVQGTDCRYSTLLLVGSDSVQYKSEKFVLFDSCFILFMIIVN